MEWSRAWLLVNLSRAAEMQGDCQGAQKPESGSVGGERPCGCLGDGSWHVGKKERRRSDMLGAFRAAERFCHAFDRYRGGRSLSLAAGSGDLSNLRWGLHRPLTAWRYGQETFSYRF